MDAMDITVILFAGALFAYAVYINIVGPMNIKKAQQAEEQVKK